ncbi:hypothetical protein EJ04DRAFT_562178 [Polyplosphaeria fusca]|uniref:Uncharacterized protein n=1 Tax=Polyplosphaeria fusca TaxID=682080 RepID=A0A9P4R4S1_9PLEO|nr:hypothetical protein EJ04DRAFT_562178 [Polyplosphaeria fusca]
MKMGLYQRRRPTPIQIVPRQEPTLTGEPESPDSPDASPSPSGVPDTPGSPDSPRESQTTISSSASSLEAASSTAPPEITSTATTSSDSTEAPAAPSETSTPPSKSSSSSGNVNGPTSTSQQSSNPVQRPTQSTGGTTATERATSIATVPSSDFSSQNAAPVLPSSTSSASAPAESEFRGGSGTNLGQEEPQTTAKPTTSGGISIGAKAALITMGVLGAIALLVGVVIFMKRRRRRQRASLRHAEDAFDPSNTGSLNHPETVHTAAHMTKSTTYSLFGADPTHRPETVSTNDSPPQSRISPPEPTPNPFADPPLNKAYDVLRGRPRSTTLTDRGSWTQNPFHDPASDRFDPFGELQEKARRERVRYMDELRREEDQLRTEQQYQEKERMGLGIPDVARKGGGVTVDRSGSNGFPR